MSSDLFDFHTTSCPKKTAVYHCALRYYHSILQDILFYTRMDADGVQAIDIRDDADWTEFPTSAFERGATCKGVKWLNRNVIRGEFMTYTEVCLIHADSQRWHKVCIEIIAEQLFNW